MENTFRAHGKLLLTGEYAIMYGAEGLALPLNRFQEMHVVKKKEQQPQLHWKAYDINGLWFDALWQLPYLTPVRTSDAEKSNHVVKIIKAIRDENPLFLMDGFSYVTTHFCNFNIYWGLGSSATLLVNLCRWAGVDPFRIYFKLYRGSGYDIASAISPTPLLYSVHNNQPRVQPVAYQPPFIDQMLLIYSGRKRNTIEAIERTSVFDTKIIEHISQLTRSFIEVNNVSDCMRLVEEHETLIAQQIGEQPIKAKLFADFPGQIKSLGAWGGDFWLAISEMQPEKVTTYFNSKGFQTVLPLKNFLTT